MVRPRLDPKVPEFDEARAQPPNELSRRDFLYLSGLTLTLANPTLIGCTRAPAQKIVPYRVQPSEVVPGRALHYASASTLDGYATGILVESHEGRPTKIEGNPAHPASLGACSALEQALLLELYDPRRLRGVSRAGNALSDEDLLGALRRAADPKRLGRGVHLVLPLSSSPLVGQQLASLSSRLPELTVHFHAPLSRAAVFRGSRLAFGTTLETRVDLGQSDVIAAIGADFMMRGPNRLALAKAFARGRRGVAGGQTMNRLYVVETTMTVTGGVADHRLPLKPSQLPAFTAALLREVALQLGDGASIPQEVVTSLSRGAGALSEHSPFVRALARDLIAQHGRAAVLVGDDLPAAVHAAGQALNFLLQSQAIEYAPSPIIGSAEDDFGALVGLRAALQEGAVESLIVFDSDIADGSPSALGLSEALQHAKESIYFGLFADRTSAQCTFRAPAAHVLESWSDTRALDGTTSIVQPLIAPLYGGRTLTELLAVLGGEPRPAHDLVKAFWRDQRPNADFDSFWENALARGVIEGTAIPRAAAPPVSFAWLPELALALPHAAEPELHLVPDGRLHDGRFANNPWLLELPCPVTKQTWGNAALLSPAFARRLGVTNGALLELTSNGQTLEAPALVVPGQADGALTLALGWGRVTADGSAPIGVNGFRLAPSDPHAPVTLYARATGRHERLALTQDTMSLGELADSILPSSTVREYRQPPGPAQIRPKRPLSMYGSRAPRSTRQWGMTIDLNVCTGCSACVIACQAENNIPSVGKSGVLMRREMHWLRIDRYLAGSEASPQVLLEPMACQHCEKAPCEYVCPTGATAHSTDGLNQMTYNRCVGTRFCSNNCPYKVRRFNWFDYHRDQQSPRELAANPEVTVRARGVMEKCTYCVQRIRRAEISAELEKRDLRDGEVQTACEQACPTEAIRFGDVADPSAEVSRLRADRRAFQVLPELGAVPRTRYLMKLTNQNPELT